jgi:hypothetical protein
MQSTEIKRHGSQRTGTSTIVALVALALVIAATVAMVALATGLFSASTQDNLTATGAGNAITVTDQAPVPQAIDTSGIYTNPPLSGAKYEQSPAMHDSLELNMTPPGRRAPKVLSSEEMRFIEINMFLPSAPSPKVLSYGEMRFLEINMDLPGRLTPKVLSTDEMRFIEMNTFLPSAPSQKVLPVGRVGFLE